MNIFGIGTDIVEVIRIQQLLEKNADAFLSRVLTESERNYCLSKKQPAIHIAARFAAKEAVSKAFGTGIGAHAAFIDIEVLHTENGAPTIRLHGAAMAYATQHQITEIKISLSHTDMHAIAYALAVTKKNSFSIEEKNA